MQEGFEMLVRGGGWGAWGGTLREQALLLENRTSAGMLATMAAAAQICPAQICPAREGNKKRLRASSHQVHSVQSVQSGVLQAACWARFAPGASKRSCSAALPWHAHARNSGQQCGSSTGLRHAPVCL